MKAREEWAGRHMVHHQRARSPLGITLKHSRHSFSNLCNTGNWNMAQFRVGKAAEGEDNLFPSGTNSSLRKGNDIT